MNQKRFYATGEISKMFGVSKSTIIQWIEKGYLESARLPSKHYRVSVNQLKKFAKEHGYKILF